MRAVLREWLARLSGLLGLSRRDHDLEQELRSHLELTEEELRRRGIPQHEAARQARLLAGQSTQTMEVLRDRRGIPPLSTFLLDIKLGLRMLRRHWGLTLVGGLALTIAITLGASVFSFLHGITGTRLPLEEGDRVVVLEPWNPLTQRRLGASMEDLERWRTQLRSVVDVGGFRTIQRNLITEAGPAGPVSIAEMSAAGFRLARVAPLLGRFLAEEDERPGAAPVIVIGYEAWQSDFAADPEVVGQRVQLDGVSYTVTGVMPRGYAFPVDHEFWAPLGRNERDDPTVFARLAPGVTMDGARAELETVGLLSSQDADTSERRAQVRVVPYIAGIAGGRGGWPARLIPILFALLLIPPCANIAVLIYARTVARQGEFAARMALGAGRWRIVGQIFIEVLLLAAAAAGLALLLAPKVAESLSFMFLFADRAFWMDFGLSRGTILFTSALALFAALIAGAIPALRATGRWQLSGLHALNRGAAPRLGTIWTAMVVAQVALSAAVVPAAAELAWSTLRTAILGPGFAAEEFLSARLSIDAVERSGSGAARFTALRSELVRRLEAEPGIGAVTMSESEPFGERNILVEIDGAGTAGDLVQDRESVAFNQVDGGFFEAFGLPLLAGRGFEAGDADPQGNAVLVNRSFVGRVLPGENPLGRRVRAVNRNGPEATYQIVGLVGDQFTRSDQPTMYRPLPAATLAQGGELFTVRLTLHTGTDTPPALATRLREIAASVDPALRIDDFETLGEVFFYLSLTDYIAGSTPALVALGVVLFSMAGIYTLMSFTVVQRQVEIGIRAALGASPWRLATGIFRRVLLPVCIGAAVGGIAAVLIGYYWSPLLFDSAGPRSLPWMLPAAEAGLILAGLVALLGPIRRALRLHPMESLRNTY